MTTPASLERQHTLATAVARALAGNPDNEEPA